MFLGGFIFMGEDVRKEQFEITIKKVGNGYFGVKFDREMVVAPTLEGILELAKTYFEASEAKPEEVSDTEEKVEARVEETKEETAGAVA